MIIVYTACFGGYDEIRPVIVESDAQFVAITDSDAEIAGWEVVNVGQAPEDPRRIARLYKTLAHRILPGADVTIWHDANVQLLVPPELLVSEWLGYADLAAPKHPSRDCAYGEANACIKKRKGNADTINAQMRGYSEEGYPEHTGLAETRVVIRRNTENVALFNEVWWSQLSTKSVRDQLSFNYSAWKSGVAWRSVDAWIPKHPWFSYHEHRGQ